MGQHSNYKFSITIQSDDLAVVHCLRSLSQFSQKTGNNRITWGNTKESDWKRDENQVTFRFTDPEYRKIFIKEAERLLPNKLWQISAQSDDNPAKPAS